jgi:BlaI family transcriptional regulator, penicillinase repressor
MRRAAPPRDIPPPLEMLCLKALWSLGEGNVTEVREVLTRSKPLAYTTVMTVLGRLAKKNVVTRRKVGRAFVYAPGISRDAIRRLALREFVDCFFDGSEQRLAEFLRRPGAGELAAAAGLEVEAGMDAALL